MTALVFTDKICVICRLKPTTGTDCHNIEKIFASASKVERTIKKRYYWFYLNMDTEGSKQSFVLKNSGAGASARPVLGNTWLSIARVENCPAEYPDCVNQHVQPSFTLSEEHTMGHQGQASIDDLRSARGGGTYGWSSLDETGLRDHASSRLVRSSRCR
jgi:hypothetical protein